jgi:hypothetical protein
MTTEPSLSALWSPLGLGAGGLAVLALVLHFAPAPRRPLRLEWSLACFGTAAVMVATALAMCGIWNAWQAGGIVLLCALTLAAGGFWLAHAPLPGELAGREGAVRRSLAAGDGAGGRLPTDPAQWRPATLPIDWDAFDRVRQQWSRSSESDRR